MDMILYNGRIHTMDDAMPLAEAVLISNGRFAVVDTNDNVLCKAHGGTELIDLHGAACYPGLIDSHLHLLHLAITARQLDVGAYRVRAEILRAISERASALAPDEILDVCGFNQDLWDDPRMITRSELDAAAPCHAVRMNRVCGHLMVANSRALAHAGISRDTPAPDGGTIDWEKGFFCENAIELLFANDQPGDVAACKELLLEAMTIAADAGLTACYSEDYTTGCFPAETVTAAYRELEKEGCMPVRVVQQCALPTAEALRQFLADGYAYGQGTDLYRLGPRKLFADGSLGARTAWMNQPYHDDPDTCGVACLRQEELNQLLADAHRVGMPTVVHAIGDAAADSVIRAILYARETVPGTDDLPDGIVHCQITSRRQLDTIAREHIQVYAQPVFAEYDLHICRDRVGAELECTSYNWKTLLQSGAGISSGSDCPVEPLDPAKNIYCAVTRKDFNGYPGEGWIPEQCLTVDEAIRCHTVNAAKAVNMDDRLGRIAEGYLADMTVYPNDLAAIPPDEIKNQKPLLTIVSGRIHHCK